MKVRVAHSYFELAEMIGEENIVKRYIPNYVKPFQNFRLRNKASDRRPSCRIIVNKNNTYYIRDFGDESFNNKAKSIPEFLMDEFNLSEIKLVDMIYEDFVHDIKRGIQRESCAVKPPKPSIIKVKYRKWQKHDIEYWGQYGLTVKDLEAADIRPISHFWIDSNSCDNELFYADKYAYTYDYYWKDGVFKRKIYQPFSYRKWFSNSDISIVQNYKNLEKEGDLLVIQTSLKDSLVTGKLDRLSIAPISESSWFTEEYWYKICERYTDAVFFANNDWNKPKNEGLLYAEKIKAKYGIPYVYIPDEFECSDISDFVAKYGIEQAYELLEMLDL